MRRIESRILWGTLLLVIGAALLINNLTGWLDRRPVDLWSVLFAVAGVGFIGAFISHRKNWWAAIPGFTLLGIALLIALERLWPAASGDWEATLVTGGMALAFLLIYITRRELWWALIPGGAILTITLMVGLENAVSDD